MQISKHGKRAGSEAKISLLHKPEDLSVILSTLFL